MTRSVDLLETLRALSHEEGRPRPGESLVVAYSGGADSTALLDLLDRWCSSGDAEAPGELVAVHLDHRLRPDSATDAEFCAEFCRRRGVDFVGASRDVAALARRTGLGVEAAGRRARQELFEELRRERGADRIATAHHLDDHLETLFLWLGRGSALSGLVGIEASTEVYLRPLRSFRRRQLREYLESRDLRWREDPSNEDRARRRNRLRAELLPLFESIFGSGAAARLDAFSKLASEERATLREATHHVLEFCRRETGEGRVLILDRERVLGLPPALRLQLLRHVVRDPKSSPRPQRWNTAHFRRVLRYMEEGRIGTDLPLPEGGRLSLDRETLTFWPPDAEPEGTPAEAGNWVLHQDLLPAGPGQVTFLQEPRGSARSVLGLEASFDAERVHGPLLLRTLRDGDRIAPAGMQGHRKKIRRLLAERAVPRHQRDRQLVVEDRQRVIWAVGLAICHSARIQESTRSVLRLRVEPEPGASQQQMQSQPPLHGHRKDPGS